MKCLRIGLIALVGLTACEKKEEETTDSGAVVSTGAGKLPVSELAKPSGLGALTRVEVTSFMTLNSWDFLATEEAEADAEESSEEDVDCFGDAFDSVTVQASGEKIVLDVNIEMAACLSQIYAKEGITADIGKALFSIYIEQTCVGTDLSSYDGKLADELANVPECAENLSLMNTSSEVIGTLASNGHTADITSKTINTSSTEDNEPCLLTKSGANYAQDACLSIYKYTGTSGTSEDEYSKYTANNQTWTASPNNSWFNSGTTTVELNDWTGTITYAGAATNPGYTMSNGTETATGTLTMPTGIFLKNSMKRVLKRFSR